MKTRIHVADAHHARLVKQYKVSKQTVRLALRYETDSTLAENIRRSAKKMLLEEAAAVQLKEDNQKQDSNGTSPTQGNDYDGAPRGAVGHEERNDRGPVRVEKTHAVPKQRIPHAVQGDAGADGQVLYQSGPTIGRTANRQIHKDGRNR